MATVLFEEAQHLRDIVLRLAASAVYRSDHDGYTYCGVCGGPEGYASLVQHADDCAYLAALAYRAERDEQSDRHWNEKAEQRIEVPKCSMLGCDQPAVVWKSGSVANASAFCAEHDRQTRAELRADGIDV